MNILRAIWSLALLDLKLWTKSPIAMGSALLPPFGMVLLLMMLTFTVLEQPVALVVEAKGPYAARMEQLIRADEEAYILRVTDAKTAERLLRDQAVAAIITIPEDFDRRAVAYDAVLHLKLNNVDIDFADDIRRSVDQAAGQFDAPGLGLMKEVEAREKGEGSPLQIMAAPISGPEKEEEEEENGPPGRYVFPVEPENNPYLIRIDEHNLRVTDVDFLHYQLIPALILLVLSVGMTGTAMACASDRERGTARLLYLAPAPAWALVAGRMLGGLLATLAVLVPAVILCIAMRMIVVPAGHWGALTALFLTASLCAAGLGAALGTAVRGARNVAMASSTLATTLFFMGGGFTTIAFLPAWIRTLSAFDPMRYAIDGLRETLFYPTLNGVVTDIVVLIGTAIGAVIVGGAMVVRSWRG